MKLIDNKYGCLKGHVSIGLRISVYLKTELDQLEIDQFKGFLVNEELFTKNNKKKDSYNCDMEKILGKTNEFEWAHEQYKESSRILVMRHTGSE